MLSWSRAPATVISPLPAPMAKAPVSFPDRTAYVTTSPGELALTVPTSVLVAASSRTEKL